MSYALLLSFPDLPPLTPPAPEEMSPELAAAYVSQRFLEQWGATTAVRLDNEAFSPPDVAWVSCTFVPVTDRPQTMGAVGNRLFFRSEIFRVEIMAPSDGGEGPALRLAQHVQQIFEGFRNGGLYVNAVARRRLGNDGRWFRVVADVAFHYHERK